MALTDSLVSYWKMDEASGNRADSHGSLTLTDNNTVTSATGQINNASQYASANSEYLSNVASAVVTAASVSFWINITSAPGSYAGLFTRDDNGGTRSQFTVYLSSNTTKLAAYVDGSRASIDPATTALGTGAWKHVVVVYDSTNGLIIYVNAVSDGTAAANGAMNNGNAPINIGRDIFNSSRYYDGLLDEMGFWSRALTSAEVSELYNGGAGLAYPFSSGAATYPGYYGSGGWS